MDGTPGSEYVKFIYASQYSTHSGAKLLNCDFKKIQTIERNYTMKVGYGEYSRLYLLIEYKK